ncbi:MAG: hypothetical protein IPN86_18165 [Saprospiraceae bacterium]|nr:hypothetical protein [Saprospiraceae bacterium]
MRRKIFSAVVENAQKRAAGLRSISTDLDLGNGLTLKAYETEIEALSKHVNDYNETLAGLDAQILMIRDVERKVRDWTERMLEGVSARFTKNSDEYSRAGGIRKVDRKRPFRRQAPSANS